MFSKRVSFSHEHSFQSMFVFFSSCELSFHHSFTFYSDWDKFFSSNRPNSMMHLFNFMPRFPLLDGFLCFPLLWEYGKAIIIFRCLFKIVPFQSRTKTTRKKVQFSWKMTQMSTFGKARLQYERVLHVNINLQIRKRKRKQWISILRVSHICRPCQKSYFKSRFTRLISMYSIKRFTIIYLVSLLFVGKKARFISSGERALFAVIQQFACWYTSNILHFQP